MRWLQVDWSFNNARIIGSKYEILLYRVTGKACLPKYVVALSWAKPFLLSQWSAETFSGIQVCNIREAAAGRRNGVGGLN
ncbi:hypothetical protein H6P81_019269 [Aristolochia fimbriata]|uniref:Uncharacterized protein n=1 Tax=Aristolochia fimbriata TaxID=158543 RepID=A0AAV7DSX6_ARIFI|nr:hypothetical protein H6P81_019269 [Aristolochia fimbriata]